EAHKPVGAPGGKNLAVRAETKETIPTLLRMPQVRSELHSCSQVPQPYGPVSAPRREELSIGADDGRPDPIRVLNHRPQGMELSAPDGQACAEVSLEFGVARWRKLQATGHPEHSLGNLALLGQRETAFQGQAGRQMLSLVAVL